MNRTVNIDSELTRDHGPVVDQERAEATVRRLLRTVARSRAEALDLIKGRR